ncbi:MAG: carboxypeptidase-like regulatory domain-containing protein [Bacteroidales bacterium]|nr:carboxypeptidase-like regulatory domain-containing protein [Bacteroidales bacterium]
MRYIISIISLFISLYVYGQEIRGIVFSNNGNTKETIAGASVYWSETLKGTITDSKGEFRLNSESVKAKSFIVSYIGFASDTIKLTGKNYYSIELKPLKEKLGQVDITAKKEGSHLSRIEPVKTEIITEKELGRAACCDLSGCFGSDATVQVSTTNVITNSKELKILGLSGIYNQVLIDGMPLIQGLSYTYGISAIPGSLIQNIYVAKGANSVLQGYESFAGQINVLLKEPDNTDNIYIGLYSNNFFERNYNLNFSTKKNKLSNLLSVNTTSATHKYDFDGDNFIDMPLIKRYYFYDKIKYGNEDSLGFFTKTGLTYLIEQRTGGQTDYNPKNDKGSSLRYGQVYDANQPSFYTKTGYRFNSNNKISFISSGFFHKQSSWFGQTHYDAGQTNIYNNLQYEWIWNEHNFLKTGTSFRYSYINEDISFTANPNNKSYNGNHITKEMIPGIFAENNTEILEEKLNLITGIRYDRHNEFGNIFTPRIFLKYKINEQNLLRGSLGFASRTAHIFSENINLLASQRDIVFYKDLKPEKAFNFGLNYTYYINLENIEGSLSLDYYRTSFINQVIPDYDKDATKAYIYNFTGKSISNSMQTEVNIKFYEIFTFKLAYNFLDVFRFENNINKIIPFNSKHRLLASFSYEPPKGNWQADATLHWFGIQKLPSNDTYPENLRQQDKSKPYSTLNAQLTKKFKHFEIYIGCENITGYMQDKPIIGWENPFGKFFDTASVWGPTKMQEYYAGLRIKF